MISIGLASILGSRTYAVAIMTAVTLALTPLLASIGALGITRVVVPGVALRDLAPPELRKLLSQGSPISAPMILCAFVVVLWAATVSVAGAKRDGTRDA